MRTAPTGPSPSPTTFPRASRLSRPFRRLRLPALPPLPPNRLSSPSRILPPPEPGRGRSHPLRSVGRTQPLVPPRRGHARLRPRSAPPISFASRPLPLRHLSSSSSDLRANRPSLLLPGVPCPCRLVSFRSGVCRRLGSSGGDYRWVPPQTERGGIPTSAPRKPRCGAGRVRERTVLDQSGWAKRETPPARFPAPMVRLIGRTEHSRDPPPYGPRRGPLALPEVLQLDPEVRPIPRLTAGPLHGPGSESGP